MDTVSQKFGCCIRYICVENQKTDILDIVCLLQYPFLSIHGIQNARILYIFIQYPTIFGYCIHLSKQRIIYSIQNSDKSCMDTISSTQYPNWIPYTYTLSKLDDVLNKFEYIIQIYNIHQIYSIHGYCIRHKNKDKGYCLPKNFTFCVLFITIQKFEIWYTWFFHSNCYPNFVAHWPKDSNDFYKLSEQI